MTFSTPVSDKAFENQKEDTLRYMEEDGCTIFSYDDGFSY